MFFSISSQKKSNFPYQYTLGNFIVNTDAGWNEAILSADIKVVYKGYVDNAPLADSLNDIVNSTSPNLTGNFCVFEYNASNDTIKINSDRYRAFPLYHKNNEITNLVPGGDTMWADGIYTVKSDYSIHKTKFDCIGPIIDSPLTWNEALDQVDEILKIRTELFLKNNQIPVKVFLSGGLDSLLAYSYIKKYYTNNYDLINYHHFDYDYFWMKNSGDIRDNHWAYTRVHHWLDNSMLISGAPGDEFMMRGPVTVQMFLKATNQNIYDLVKPNDYMYSYFTHPEFESMFTDFSNPAKTYQELVHKICNNLINDWQHWHLGNTLMWTPLRDLEIIKIMLRIPVDELVNQLTRGQFSIDLIARNTPDLVKSVSAQKNIGNARSNLTDLFFNNM